MQLTIISTVFCLFLLCQELKAQLAKALPAASNLDVHDQIEIVNETFEKPDWQSIDINFLSSYYVQDGNNSPVTGGIGTEYLTDWTQKIMFSIPASPKVKLNFDAGYDYYSSASTDNIDNIRSSDSASDMRIHGNAGVSYQVDNHNTLGLRVGGSGEYDYTSINGGLTYDWISANENTAIGISGQAFIDQWVLYYPRELRGQGRLVPTDKRQSYNGSISFSQVLNKKMQLSLNVEGIYMQGLLSTPFHRVYFKNEDLAVVEQLPSSRLKIPLGARLNTYLSDWLISRLYYRYYWDDWGVAAHTMSVELPLKFSRFISIYPSYRYHTQSEANYFAPYQENDPINEFYTSDYDLSALSSQTYGLGLTIAPAEGLARMKIPFSKSTAMFLESIDVKYSHYRRSTGLNANIVSLGMKFVIR